MKNNHRLLFGDMKLCNVCCIMVKNKAAIDKCEAWCKKDKNCKHKTKCDSNFIERRQK